MKPSTKERADLSKTTHVFVQGQGYLEAGPLLLHPETNRAAPGASAQPPSGVSTPDGSRHVLLTPGARTPKVFAWVAREGAWERAGGNRIAWPASYLTHHGWIYSRPAEEDEV